MLGLPRRLTKRRKLSKNAFVLNDETSSKCTALYTARVYRQIQAFLGLVEKVTRRNRPQLFQTRAHPLLDLMVGALHPLSFFER